DEVRMDVTLFLCRVDRAFWVRADDQDLGPVLLEVTADARDRPAGSDRDDDCVDLPAGLLEDLWSRMQVVRLGVRHVRVLVRLESAGDLFREPVGNRVIRLG